MFYNYKGQRYQITIEKIYIELTTACNAKCPYCYNPMELCSKNIDASKLEKFLDDILNQGIRTIHLSGGEPLLHPNYMSFVDRINENGGKVLTVSNGFLITEEHLNTYMKQNMLQLTIDSMVELEHDRTRGNGNYKKVMEIIEYCRKNGHIQNIYLRHNVIRGNENDRRKFVEFALEKGISKVSMSVLRNMGRAKENSFMLYDYKDNLQEILCVNADMASLRKEYESKIEINSNRFENQKGCPYNRPGEYYMSPRIDCYGNLYICESFDGKDNIVGNVFENSLEEIFASKHFEEYMKVLFTRQENMKGCKKCLLNKLCTGGCPADQYAECGNYLHCTSQCAMIKENFKNELLKQRIL